MTVQCLSEGAHVHIAQTLHLGNGKSTTNQFFRQGGDLGSLHILDSGGESTRPGSDAVALEEELRNQSI